jgi:hypothetical protein
VDKGSHTDSLKNSILWRLCRRVAALDMRVGIHSDDSKYMAIVWRNIVLCFRSLPMGMSPSVAALKMKVDEFLDE